jgi:hypothetical protein
MTSSVVRVAALAATTGLAATAVLQTLLALGVPWGRAAWGGGHDRLPGALRVASALSAAVLVAAGVVVLGRAGYWSGPSVLLRWGTWALVGLLAFSALGNFASGSRWEKFLLGPVALSVSLLCLIVALKPG